MLYPWCVARQLNWWVVQWADWNVSVSYFVITRWYSRVFVDGLSGVNPDAWTRWFVCVTRAFRCGDVTGPLFPLLTDCVIQSGFYARKHIFAAPQKPVMLNVYLFRRTKIFYVACFVIISVPGGSKLYVSYGTNISWLKNLFPRNALVHYFALVQ